MKRTDKAVTAADLAARLARNPAFQAAEVERQHTAQANAERYDAAAAPVLRDLAEIGVEVHSLGDLRRRRRPTAPTVGVLLQWMSAIDYPPVKEDIVRTLAVRGVGARVARALVSEFERTRDPDGRGLGWVIGLALGEIADDAVIDDVVRLVQTPSYGAAREMLPGALLRSSDPRAATALAELIKDSATAPYIAAATRFWGSRRHGARLGSSSVD